MNGRAITFSLLLLVGCGKADDAKSTDPLTPNAAAADKKHLLDKAKDAVGNIKEGATTPLTEKSVSNLLGVVNDLKAEIGKVDAGKAMDMKALMSKAKDLKAIAEKHGLKTSELTGLVARVAAVMSAVNSGQVPDELKADAALLEQHKAELQGLFQKN